VKLAFVLQPWDTGSVPPRNSTSIWTYEVARRLSGSCSVLVYRNGGGAARDEVVDGIDYRQFAVGKNPWFLKPLSALDWSSSHRPFRRYLFPTKGFYARFGLQVAADLRRERCDIVHIHNFFQFVPAIRSLNPHIQIVLHMHCEWLTGLRQRLILPILQQVDLVVGCSNHVTRSIQQRYPDFSDRCVTVYNGVDVDRFSPDTLRSETSEQPTILYVGRISPEKGLHVLFEAFNRVLANKPDAHLNIVGQLAMPPLELLIALSDDPSVAGLASFYDTNYLEYLLGILSPSARSRVTFPCLERPVPQADILDHYRRADLLANPSLSESFGMSLVEAMAVELPVIVARTGGMPEIVQDGVTGLILAPGDPNALAAAAIELLSDDRGRRSMGRAGRMRAAEVFAWDTIVEHVQSVYERLVASGNHATRGLA
jgi:glycosyltransferase involved in cell wall biosynthesis